MWASATGQRMYAVTTGLFYYSTDFGATWNFNVPLGTSSSNWNNIAASSDGQTVAIGISTTSLGPADVRLTLTAQTSSLEFIFEPLDSGPILVSIPLAIVVNNSRTWLYAVVAFLAGSIATYFWFANTRRRRRRAMPPPPVA